MIQKNDLVRIKNGWDLCASGLSYGTVYEVQDVRGGLVRLHVPMQTPSFRFMPADSLIVIGQVKHTDDVDAVVLPNSNPTIAAAVELRSIATALAKRCDKLTRHIRKMDSELDDLSMALYDLEWALS